MFGLGIGEGLILLAIILVMFGAKKLPGLGKAMGESINSFKKGLNESSEDSDANKEQKKSEVENNNNQDS